MLFDKPAGSNVADKKVVLGRAVTRIDGPLKTTGLAPYAYERHDVSAAEQLYGYPVVSGIAKGRILSMDTTKAKAAPGVVDVITTLDMDRLGKTNFHYAYLFGGDQVEFYHQAIGVVVAETFEKARAAANLIETKYMADTSADFDFSTQGRELANQDVEPEASVGDFETAFRTAPVKLDETYTTPGQSHIMMEPHASIAEWKGGKLSLWTSNQMIEWGRQAVATILDMSPDDILLDSPYIGGGFGAKLFVRVDAVLAALAARKTGRSVKVILPRPIIANNTAHRAGTIQKIRIGADQDGRIIAIAHDNTSYNQPYGDKGENSTAPTRAFYAGDHRLIIDRKVTMHMPESHAMRAPGETAGLMALEIAMDEMAEKLGMDPVEFRVVNDVQYNPEKPEQPFSQRNFVETLRVGAERFGWADRNTKPGQMRDGHWLIGHGMAGAYREAPVMASGARLRLQPGPKLVVETDMTDIGTGSYTIIAQTAAEMLGLAVEQIEVKLGSSAMPVSAGSGGQWGAASSTSGVYAAAVALRQIIAERINRDPDDLVFRDGIVTVGNENYSLDQLVENTEIVAEDTIRFEGIRKQEMFSTFGSHFVEVGVHAATGEIRVRRMLAVCDAGRILNPLTARSQVIGAMTMGVGGALMEELAPDTKYGLFINHDMAGYEVPVHADIPEQEVIFLDYEDEKSNPLKAKGIGELGLCGVSAAVANAVYNATGVRVRDYPITLDKFLADMPAI